MTRDLTHLIIGVLTGIFLFSIAALRQQTFNPEEFGLGQNTVTYHGSFEGIRTAQTSDTKIISDSFRKLRAGGHQTALWLGASQLHGINHPKEDDALAVVYASREAARLGSPLVYLQLSSPNANLHDLLGFYLTLRAQDHVPDWLVVGLVYDDLREKNMQAQILSQLPAISDDLIAVGGEGISHVSRFREDFLENQHRSAQAVERNATSNTPQEHLESFLIETMERFWPGYQYRGLLDSKIKTLLYSTVVRAVAKNVEKRPPFISEELKIWNLSALDSLLKLAAQDKTKVLIYKPPHRPGGDPFYHDRKAYDAFFSDIEKRAGTGEFFFADFELLVGKNYWGKTNEGRPDFFHFQDTGHRLLGAEVAKRIKLYSDGAKNAV